MSDELEVELGDSVYTLKCTIGALRKINKKYSALLDCTQRVARYDIDAISTVMAAGADLSADQTKAMESALPGNLERVTSAISTYLDMFLGPPDQEKSQSGE